MTRRRQLIAYNILVLVHNSRWRLSMITVKQILFFCRFVELYAKKSWKILSKILGMIHWKLKKFADRHFFRNFWQNIINNIE